MALTLVVQETFSSLLVVTLNGVRMDCHVGCRIASSLMSIAMKEVCHLKRGFATSVCRVNLMALTC
jgi:hypothetical protein